MDRFQEIIAALSDEALVAAASDEELEALRAELREFAVNVRSGETEVEDRVGTLTTAADYFQGIQYVQAERAEHAAQQAAAVEALADRMGLNDDPAGDPEPLQPAPAAPAAPTAVPEPTPEPAPALAATEPEPAPT